MKITVDESVCLKHKMTPHEVLLSLVIRSMGRSETLKKTLDNMLAREIIVEKGGVYMVTQHWSDVVDEVLCDSGGQVEKTDEELRELAIKMRELYPEGRMLDKFTGMPTSYYFRCNVPEITRRLKTFFTRYGNRYTDEEILDATKKYVASYNGNYQQKGFRLIKYFIFKDDVKQGPDGNYVEPLSPLLDFLENKESGEEAGVVINDENWMVNVRN